jgi:hypothetical protein
MSILSVHLADVGARSVPGTVRQRLTPAGVPGLRYAQLAAGAPLSSDLLPRPKLGRVGLIASWDDDQALDAFLETHPLAQRFAGGFHVRLEPLRVVGSWSGLPDLPVDEKPIADDEPVAVLTLGRLRLNRAAAFLRANAPASGEAAASDAVILATGLARPPRFVATFSLWRNTPEMRAVVVGPDKLGHRDAMKAHAARSFHHESAFVRFRPYAPIGEWEGKQPLAQVSFR